MDVLYSSTRGNGKAVKASEAILQGLAEDGGLFVPDHIPVLDKSLKELSGMTYQEVAYEVMKLFLTDFTEEELKNCINRAYDDKFDTEDSTLSGGRRSLLSGTFPRFYYCLQGYGAVHPAPFDDHFREKKSYFQ